MSVSPLHADPRARIHAPCAPRILVGLRLPSGLLRERLAKPFFLALGWSTLGTVASVNFIAFAMGLTLASYFPRLFHIPNSRIASLRRRRAFAPH